MTARTLADLTVGLPVLDSTPERAPSSATGDPISRDDLRSVLSWLDPNEPRADWLKHVAAIRAAPVPDDQGEHFRRELARAWSAGELDRLDRYKDARPARYTDAEAVDQAFDTMPPKEGGAGVGSLIAAARQAGFTGSLGPSVVEWAESLGLKLLAPTKVEPVASRGRIILRDERMQDARPPTNWLVEPVIPERGNVVIHAPWEHYKSFLASDLALSVAAGVLAFGKLRVPRSGPVVALLGEGAAGFETQRRPAWRTARGIDAARVLPIYTVEGVPQVRSSDDVAAYLDALRQLPEPPVLIMVDTLSRAMAGLNENDAGDAALYLNAAEAMGREFGCAVLTVAHEGKEGERGLRGSSAFPAGFDAVWRVEADTDAHTAKLIPVKLKDDAAPEPIHLQGRTVSTEGRKPSLVFDWAPPGDYRGARPKGITNRDVGTALVSLGAQKGTTVKTAVLAFTLAGPGADDNLIEAMSRALQRGAKDRFASYVAHLGKGARDPSLWTVPAVENGGLADA